MRRILRKVAAEEIQNSQDYIHWEVSPCWLIRNRWMRGSKTSLASPSFVLFQHNLCCKLAFNCLIERINYVLGL